VTIARSLSDTFAGIAPSGVLAFIAAQLGGMLVAVAVGRWLWPSVEIRAVNEGVHRTPELRTSKTQGRSTA
jgi:hypothetical protein